MIPKFHAPLGVSVWEITTQKICGFENWNTRTINDLRAEIMLFIGKPKGRSRSRTRMIVPSCEPMLLFFLDWCVVCRHSVPVARTSAAARTHETLLSLHSPPSGPWTAPSPTNIVAARTIQGWCWQSKHLTLRAQICCCTLMAYLWPSLLHVVAIMPLLQPASRNYKSGSGVCRDCERYI